MLLPTTNGRPPQVVKLVIWMVVEVALGKGHTQTALINARNLAHSFSVNLVHACVAPSAALLAEEVAGICDT